MRRLFVRGLRLQDSVEPELLLGTQWAVGAWAFTACVVSAKHRLMVSLAGLKVGLEAYAEPRSLCASAQQRLVLDLPRLVPQCLWQRVQRYMPRQVSSDTLWHGSSCYTFFVYAGPKKQSLLK